MTTTNALTLLLRESGLKKTVDFNVLPIEKNRAEMMDFSKVLDQVGTAVSAEKTETKNEYRPVETSRTNENTDDSKLQKEEAYLKKLIGMTLASHFSIIFAIDGTITLSTTCFFAFANNVGSTLITFGAP